MWRIPEDSAKATMACYIMHGGTYGIAEDYVPPTVQLFAHGRFLTFKLTDNASGVDDSEVRCKIDGHTAIAEFEYDQKGGAIWTREPLTRGRHTVEFSAKDRAGNTLNATRVVSLR